MNANENRLRDWIEKADHDLGTAIDSERQEEAIQIVKGFREFLKLNIGFEIE